MPLCTRSAASSAPAPPESSDKTMMSAGPTGSSTTRAHPAARKIGSRRERTATIADAANASTTRIAVDLGPLRFISAMSPGATIGSPLNGYYHTVFPVQSVRLPRSIAIAQTGQSKKTCYRIGQPSAGPAMGIVPLGQKSVCDASCCEQRVEVRHLALKHRTLGNQYSSLRCERRFQFVDESAGQLIIVLKIHLCTIILALAP